MSGPDAPLEVPSDDPAAIAASTAITEGDIPALRTLLSQIPKLATALIVSRGPGGLPGARTLLHIATDWPGHFPDVAETIHLLVSAGADVSAPFQRGRDARAAQPPPHEETPLHWAASNDDVVALDALLAEGAAIDAPGSVLGGGAPLTNAVWFRQWCTAERLVESGAAVTLAQAAGMGLTDRVEAMLSSDAGTTAREEHEVDVSRALWYACHGGRLEVARVLVRHGADVNWRPPWGADVRPLDAAREAGTETLARWLEDQGALTGRENSGASSDDDAPEG